MGGPRVRGARRDQLVSHTRWRAFRGGGAHRVACLARTPVSHRAPLDCPRQRAELGCVPDEGLMATAALHGVEPNFRASRLRASYERREISFKGWQPVHIAVTGEDRRNFFCALARRRPVSRAFVVRRPAQQIPPRASCSKGPSNSARCGAHRKQSDIVHTTGDGIRRQGDRWRALCRGRCQSRARARARTPASIAWAMARTAFSMPKRTASATMAWPMLSSTIGLMRATSTTLACVSP